MKRKDYKVKREKKDLWAKKNTTINSEATENSMRFVIYGLYSFQESQESIGVLIMSFPLVD